MLTENILKKENSLALPKVGQVVNGKIVGTKASAVFIDLGPIGTGIVYGREFYEAKEALKDLKPGDEISAKVVDPDNEEGYVELSLKQASQELAWKRLREKKEKNETIVVKILGANKGGLLAKAANIPGFLPVSHLSPKHYPRVEDGDKLKIARELQKFVGEELEVKIFDIDQRENKLIFSEKAQQFSEMKKGFKNLKKGAVVEGEITGIVDFGAFVRFFPPDQGEEEVAPVDKSVAAETGQEASSQPEEKLTLEGLIHISELDWQLIDDPKKVVKKGQKVKAKIIDISDNRISLSLKALKKNPWEDIEKKYKKGDVVKGRVAKFNPFGAFVQLTCKVGEEASPGKKACLPVGKELSDEAKIQGLVHISEFGSEAKMKKALELDKEYDFQILQVDPKEHKIALKMKSEIPNPKSEKSPKLQ